MKSENIEDQDNNDFLKVVEIQQPREFIINKPVSRGLQGPYKRLPSNRIRSNKEELINKKQELRNKEEEVLTKEEVIKKEALIKKVIVIKYRKNSAADGEGLKTAEQVKAYQKQWTIKKSGSSSHNVKSGGFCDYDQRTYDFDLLEKQLLGQAY